MSAVRTALLAAVLAAATAVACVERMTAPGDCPDYCPGGRVTLVDTLLATGISRDSAFRGYVLANQSAVMLAADLPGLVDARAIFRFSAVGQRFLIKLNDTTTGAIQAGDSARLTFFITRRDTAAHDLTVRLYRLPITIDTTKTFADVSQAFTDSLLRTVNLDSLMAQAKGKDTVTGDSIGVDTTNHRLFVSLKLDSSQARYLFADSGKVAYGLRVSADSLASIALGKADLSPLLRWYIVVDSLGTAVKRPDSTRTGPAPRGTPVATFVFAPPAPALDSTLVVGGVPSARSILRVAFPRSIRDSGQIIRGTLILVPAVAARGVPADSFVIEAHTVFADFGAKSPIVFDVTRTDTTVIHVGSTDTIQIEITNLLKFWQTDTTLATTIVLKSKYEARAFPEIRFYPSAAAAYRPAVRITYVPRFPFGKP
jgi:hypothetical protein